MRLSISRIAGDVQIIRNPDTGQVIAVATVNPQHAETLKAAVNRNNAFETAPRSAMERMVQA